MIYKDMKHENICCIRMHWDALGGYPFPWPETGLWDVHTGGNWDE